MHSVVSIKRGSRSDEHLGSRVPMELCSHHTTAVARVCSELLTNYGMWRKGKHQAPISPELLIHWKYGKKTLSQ
jgi:hypothetical protein